MLERFGAKMTLAEWTERKIPEYYDGMYRDGFSPVEILYAARKKWRQQEAERQEAQEAQIPQKVKFVVEVKTK